MTESLRAALERIADIGMRYRMGHRGDTLDVYEAVRQMEREARAALASTSIDGVSGIGLADAAQEVLAADAAAETGEPGADQRWDAALEGLRAALAKDGEEGGGG